MRPGERRGRGRFARRSRPPARGASRAASLRAGAPAGGDPRHGCRRAWPAPRPTRRWARSRPDPASSPRSAGCRKVVDSRDSCKERPPDRSHATPAGEDGDRPCGGRVQLMRALLSRTRPRGVPKRERISAAGAPEAIALPSRSPGDVLAVVLTIAPIQGTVLLLGRLTTTERDSPDHPGMACTIRGLDPSLLIAGCSSSRHAVAVGIEARSVQIEAVEEPGHALGLGPQPGGLQRDRTGGCVSRPDVVPAIALAGDHRSGARIGEGHQHPNRAAIEAPRPARRPGPSGCVPRRTARGRERPGPDGAEMRSGNRGLDRGWRLLGRAGDGGGDEEPPRRPRRCS